LKYSRIYSWKTEREGGRRGVEEEEGRGERKREGKKKGGII
jgi:hypothetical protein